METDRADRQGAHLLALSPEERQALVRVLWVVADNWWLDPVEWRLLARLDGSADLAIVAGTPTAA